MHRDVYQAVRPPSCLAILIKSPTILQRGLPKLHYFDTPCLKLDANTLQKEKTGSAKPPV